jgi:hypothetical protein
MTNTTLKPGSKKKIQLKIKEIARLKKLYQESNQLAGLGRELGAVESKALLSDIAELQKKVVARLKVLAQEIKAVKAEEQSRRTDTLQPLIKMINRDCQKYIKAFRTAGKALYRGSKDHGAAFAGRSWVGRATLDSSEHAQAYYDAALDQMGIAAKRGNSIFATSDPSHAGNYGTIYVVFPKDSAAFSWARKKAGKDITLYSGDLIDGKFADDLNKKVNEYLESKGKDQDIYGHLVYDILHSDGFGELIRYLKKIRFPGINAVTIDRVIDVKKIMKMYAPTDQDLASAIKSGHEVLISGEYYAVKFDENGAAVLDALGIKHPPARIEN